MSDILPTVRVKSGDSHANINVSDFDPKVHELLDPADAHLVGGAVAAAPAAAKPKGTKAAADPELAGLRKDYKAKFGKGASSRWTAKHIREKLAAA